MEAAALPASPSPAAGALPRRPWPESRPLRGWQQEALEALFAREGTEFLASATPAAGKTTFGLRVAYEFLASGRAARVVVAAPTTHICRQWAAAAAAVGIDLEPCRTNADGPEPRDRDGIAVTYQTIAAGPRGHLRAANARRTLLIADEPHHMGELAAWGASAAAAFAPACFRLLLSGTPFRSDNTAIPWITYDDAGESSADFAYGYTRALLDGVCRPITFLAYDGEMEWVSGGRRRRAGFETGLPRAESARRLRTALEAGGDFVGSLLRDADAKLSEVRAQGHADAGGLVIAADKEHARALAQRLAEISGEDPLIVTSDDPDGSDRIERFAAGRARWLVSVLMVSEGVDVPRLRVGVYATAARTELFFRQVVGRFVRRTPRPRGQMAWLLMPADPQLKALAATVEEERNHALESAAEGEERDVSERGEGESWTALSSSAHLDAVIRSTTAPGDALQLFAEPAHDALQAFGGALGSAAPSSLTAGEAAYSRRERLRAERAAMVSRLARRTGESHAGINARLNAAVGAESVAGCSDEQLQKANERLERWLARSG